MLSKDHCKQMWIRFSKIIDELKKTYSDLLCLEGIISSPIHDSQLASSIVNEQGTCVFNLHSLLGEENEDIEQLISIRKFNTVKGILEVGYIKFNAVKGRLKKEIVLTLDAACGSCSFVPENVLSAAYISDKDWDSFATSQDYITLSVTYFKLEAVRGIREAIAETDDNADDANKRKFTRVTQSEWEEVTLQKYAAEITDILTTLILLKGKGNEVNLRNLTRSVIDRIANSNKLKTKITLKETKNDTAIVDSISEFLNMIASHKIGTRKKEHQRLLNVLCVAVTPPGSQMSARALSKRLKVRKDNLFRAKYTRNILSENFDNQEEDEESDEEIEGIEEIEKTRTIEEPNTVRTPISRNENINHENYLENEEEEEELFWSEDEDGEDWDNVEREELHANVELQRIEDNDDDEEVENNEEEEDEKEDDFIAFHMELMNLIEGSLRKERKDKINASCCRDHQHLISFIDSYNKSGGLIVRSLDGKNCTYHDVRIQKYSIEEMYKMFLESDIYKMWQKNNKYYSKTKHGFKHKTPKIGIEIYRKAMCPCIKKIKQYDCSDKIQVDNVELIKSFHSHISKPKVAEAIKSCDCEYHKKIRNMNTVSQNELFSTIFCEKESKAGVTIAAFKHATPADQIRKENIEYVSTKMDSEFNALKRMKREKAIPEKTKVKPENHTLGEFNYFKRCCMYNECSKETCGVKYYFAEDIKNCPIFNKEEIISVILYEQCDRPTSAAQWEQHKKELTINQLLIKLIQSLLIAAPHNFDLRWNLHSRRLFLNTFPPWFLSLLCDFSATYNINPNFRVNSFVPQHIVQLVFVASHSPKDVILKNGSKKRIIINDSWSFWTMTKDHLTKNQQLVLFCTDYIIAYYKKMGIHFTKIVMSTDACTEQFRSRKTVYVDATAPDRYNAKEFHHDIAPPGGFKTIVDSCGGVTKRKHDDAMKNQKADSRDAWNMYKYLRDHNKAEEPPSYETRELLHIDNWIHKYVTDIKDATEEQKADPGTLISSFEDNLIDSTKLRNISQSYQFISKGEGKGIPIISEEDMHDNKAFESKEIKKGTFDLLVRRAICYCAACMRGNEKDCIAPEITGPCKKESLTFIQPDKEKVQEQKLAKRPASKKIEPIINILNSTPTLGSLNTGDKVEARWNGKDRWFKATLTGVINTDFNNLKYNVEYDDGVAEEEVHHMCVRPFIEYRVGEKVVAAWEGNDEWYNARVKELKENNTYLVIFDKHRDDIRKEEGVVTSDKIGRDCTPTEKAK